MAYDADPFDGISFDEQMELGLALDARREELEERYNTFARAGKYDAMNRVGERLDALESLGEQLD